MFMSDIFKTLKVIPANTEDKRQILLNLSQLYQHDMAQFNDFLSGDLPSSNGLYGVLPYFDLYWKEENRFPFLFQNDDKPIGFALVNTIGTTSLVNWNMAEFFIVNGCRRKGLGRQVAKQIIRQFPGMWEIAVIPENKRALSFWESAIKATFPQEIVEPKLQIVQIPKPYPMKIFQVFNR